MAACRATPPEQALREQVAAMEAAIEARDAGALAERVADDFAGPGGMDRDGLRRLAAVTFLRNQAVGLALGPLEVEVFGDRATVSFTAAATGGGGWLPERGEVYRVRTGWRLEGGDWLLISADWER